MPLPVGAGTRPRIVWRGTAESQSGGGAAPQRLTVKGEAGSSTPHVCSRPRGAAPVLPPPVGVQASPTPSSLGPRPHAGTRPPPWELSHASPPAILTTIRGHTRQRGPHVRVRSTQHSEENDTSGGGHRIPVESPSSIATCNHRAPRSAPAPPPACAAGPQAGSSRHPESSQSLAHGGGRLDGGPAAGCLGETAAPRICK